MYNVVKVKITQHIKSIDRPLDYTGRPRTEPTEVDSYLVFHFVSDSVVKVRVVVVHIVGHLYVCETHVCARGESQGALGTSLVQPTNRVRKFKIQIYNRQV